MGVDVGLSGGRGGMRGRLEGSRNGLLSRRWNGRGLMGQRFVAVRRVGYKARRPARLETAEQTLLDRGGRRIDAINVDLARGAGLE